jgi:16S rRNA (guanine966-N2)-methyltransferase
VRNKLRIIAGQWRGRKLSFGDSQGLRPTLDRVRETLFNWLSSDIYQANCLDLFSGSGALGFEALSRGAAQVTMVDNHKLVCQQLKKNLALLSCQKGRVVCDDAQTFLKNFPLPLKTEKEETKKYSIVFLDPPFNQGLLEKYCQLAEDKQLLSHHCLLYIECEKQLSLDFIPKNWQLIKQKQAGQLAYYLFQREEQV